ncbi:unnamed protein product [Amoebophrya sp. A120]|nr:unnamed protein product [Amoebophrya sp. A120]|eukprot:GSA120T00017059001.1
MVLRVGESADPGSHVTTPVKQTSLFKNPAPTGDTPSTVAKDDWSPPEDQRTFLERDECCSGSASGGTLAKHTSAPSCADDEDELPDDQPLPLYGDDNTLDPETRAQCIACSLYSTQGDWRAPGHTFTVGQHESNQFSISMQVGPGRGGSSLVSGTSTSSSSSTAAGRSTATSASNKKAARRGGGNASSKLYQMASTNAKAQLAGKASAMGKMSSNKVKQEIKVVVEQDPRANGKLGITGGRVWDAAVVMAKFFENLYLDDDHISRERNVETRNVDLCLSQTAGRPGGDPPTDPTDASSSLAAAEQMEEEEQSTRRQHPRDKQRNIEIAKLLRIPLTSSKTNPNGNSTKKVPTGAPLPVKMLELGAGTGLCGIASAVVLPPKSLMVITDQAEHLGLLQRNVEAHSWCKQKLLAKEFDWAAEEVMEILEEQNESKTRIAENHFRSSCVDARDVEQLHTAPLMWFQRPACQRLLRRLQNADAGSAGGTYRGEDLADNYTDLSKTKNRGAVDHGESSCQRDELGSDLVVGPRHHELHDPFDLVIASDVIYHEEVVDIFVRALQALLDSGACKAGFVAFELRSSNVTEHFLTKCFLAFHCEFLEGPPQFQSDAVVLLYLKSKLL